MAGPQGPHGCQMLGLTCWQQLPQGPQGSTEATCYRCENSGGSGNSWQECLVRKAQLGLEDGFHCGPSSLTPLLFAQDLCPTDTWNSPHCPLVLTQVVLLHSSNLDLHGSQLSMLLTNAWSPCPPLEPQPCSLALKPHLPTSWGLLLRTEFHTLISVGSWSLPPFIGSVGSQPHGFCQLRRSLTLTLSILHNSKEVSMTALIHQLSLLLRTTPTLRTAMLFHVRSLY